VPLETASFIHELDPANPAGTDQLAQGDDHLRMLKAALQATFPNITGPVTKSHTELNATNFSMPVGIITAWYGSSLTVPAGWAICNGQTVPLSAGGGNITTPDLRDLVIVGAGSGIAAQGTQTGATTSSVNTGSAGSHTHSISGGDHTHAVTVDSGTATGSIGLSTAVVDGAGDPDETVVIGVNFVPDSGHIHTAQTASATPVMSASTDGTHQHSVQVSTVQPSYGLHYIMKV
jgi:microcystin-dependent protein